MNDATTMSAPTIAQSIALWIYDSLDPRESPRCPDYPECGGEDGSGHLEKSEHRHVLENDHHGGRGRARDGWIAYREQVVEAAPRCKACKAYSRAVDRALAKLRKQFGP